MCAAVTNNSSINKTCKPFAHDVEPIQFTITILFIDFNLISEYVKILVEQFTIHCKFFFHRRNKKATIMQLTLNDYTPECIYLVAQKQSTRLCLQFVLKSFT